MKATARVVLALLCWVAALQLPLSCAAGPAGASSAHAVPAQPTDVELTDIQYVYIDGTLWCIESWRCADGSTLQNKYEVK